jgi:PIN domain nuclease of toxin-antitoxin system
MMMLDTHVWVWWLTRNPNLEQPYADVMERGLAEGLAVSVISCWEIGMLVAKGRLQLSKPVREWVDEALSPPEMHLLPLTPEIAVASTMLPGDVRGDPADRMIIATARVYDLPLVTADREIRAYPHVKVLP